MAGTQTSVYLLIAHFLSCILVCRQDSSGAARDNGVSESSRRFRTEFLQEWPQQAGAPSFDPSTPHNVTGLVGTTVSLACRVRNLRNRTVSWVRHRDIHLLTVGRYTYTSDQRFEAQHRPRSEEWALLIRSPQRRDSGQYECQISTTPPIGHSVHLSIVEPETTIQSGPDLFIYAGSTINLTCTVRHTPSPPESISWSHKGQVINFDSSRGGISLVTEKGASSNSRLLVQRARAADAGVYSCAPDKAPTASTRVHVLTDESPAAMHGGVHTCARSLPSALLAAACSLGLPALMRARFLCR